MDLPTAGDAPLVGALFTRNYRRPESPLKDSPELRMRIGGFAHREFLDQRYELATFFRVEGGYEVQSGPMVRLSEFFQEAPIERVLNAITLVWRFAKAHYRYLVSRGVPSPWLDDKKALNWHKFVERAFREESVGYTVDAYCAVHYLVDSEFESARSAAVSGLGAKRYSGVLAAFEQAHRHFDASPADFKAAVRAAFEALEILARLMVPDSQNLNKRMIELRLKPLALGLESELAGREVVSRLMDGLGSFVDGIHFYRHGQGVESVINPSEEIATYVLSSVATSIRWLIKIDQVVNVQE